MTGSRGPTSERSTINLATVDLKRGVARSGTGAPAKTALR
jgi:hypothetical protein